MRIVLCTVAFLLLGTSAASANNRYMFTGGVIAPPVGWLNFCERYPADCASTPSPDVFTLIHTDHLWSLLVQVNTWVNRVLIYKSDDEHWRVPERWDYAEDGLGDCEDYTLVKRRMLLGYGVPLSALRIAFINNVTQGHVVLIVRTTEGEYVLDNTTDLIVRWDETRYPYTHIQSQRDQNTWVQVLPPPFSAMTAAAKAP